MSRRELQGTSQSQGESESVPSTRTSKLRELAVNLLVSIGALFLFFGSVELILALVGVQPTVVDEDPYVGFQGSLRLFELSDSGQEMRTAPNKLKLFNRQAFPRRKSSDTFRVFTMGGSTTYGLPGGLMRLLNF